MNMRNIKSRLWVVDNESKETDVSGSAFLGGVFFLGGMDVVLKFAELLFPMEPLLMVFCVLLRLGYKHLGLLFCTGTRHGIHRQL